MLSRARAARSVVRESATGFGVETSQQGVRCVLSLGPSLQRALQQQESFAEGVQSAKIGPAASISSTNRTNTFFTPSFKTILYVMKGVYGGPISGIKPRPLHAVKTTKKQA
jgi:hypothetical protein